MSLRKALIQSMLFFALFLLPLFGWWWLFFILAMFAVFIMDKIFVVILAAVLLDSIYVGGAEKLPVLTLFVFAMLIVRESLRGRMRSFYGRNSSR